MWVLIELGLDVPNFTNDVTNFTKDVPNFIKDVPNFLKDVPKGSIVRLKVLIISDHFLMGSQMT